jgi:hypothetical protein
MLKIHLLLTIQLLFISTHLALCASSHIINAQLLLARDNVCSLRY